MRVLVGLFLVAHGLVHLLYLAPRPADDPKYPFVPETRWLPRATGMAPGAAKAVAGVLAVLTAVAFALAGVALWFDAGVWETAAVAGSIVSLALMLLFFHRWLLIGIAIDLGIAGSIWWWHVPASLFD
jgi:hypothetical protein